MWAGAGSEETFANRALPALFPKVSRALRGSGSRQPGHGPWQGEEGRKNLPAPLGTACPRCPDSASCSPQPGAGGWNTVKKQKKQFVPAYKLTQDLLQRSVFLQDPQKTRTCTNKITYNRNRQMSIQTHKHAQTRTHIYEHTAGQGNRTPQVKKGESLSERAF